VWMPRLRYWVLLSGVCLHAAIEYALNIPLFSLTIVATYILWWGGRSAPALGRRTACPTAPAPPAKLRIP